MQFIRDNNEYSIEEFATEFPGEFKILKEHEDKDWNFVIKGKLIKFLHGEYKPVFIDIASILEKHRIYFNKNSFYKESLAKALGIKKGKTRNSFCDATGGLLSDSLMMYCFDIDNFDIYERHPVAATLITNALGQVDLPIKFSNKSALDISRDYDVIFFDPMYEDKNTKSAPKKEMQIFREVIGSDVDAVTIAEHLKSKAKERLVIKRPAKSNFLLEAPSHQIKGKSTRYDVYMNV